MSSAPVRVDLDPGTHLTVPARAWPVRNDTSNDIEPAGVTRAKTFALPGVGIVGIRLLERRDGESCSDTMSSVRPRYHEIEPPDISALDDVGWMHRWSWGGAVVRNGTTYSGTYWLSTAFRRVEAAARIGGADVIAEAEVLPLGVVTDPNASTALLEPSLTGLSYAFCRGRSFGVVYVVGPGGAIALRGTLDALVASIVTRAPGTERGPDGMPAACAEYRAVLDRLGRCDKLAPEMRESYMKSIRDHLEYLRAPPPNADVAGACASHADRFWSFASDTCGW